MKLFLMLTCLVIAFSSFADAPRCVGTQWMLDDVIFLNSHKRAEWSGGENCNGRVAYCNFQGTDKEGWYTYDASTEMAVTFDRCSFDFTYNSKPKCKNVGTRSEGWYINDDLVSYGSCANRNIVCAKVGSKSEGWVSYDSSNITKLYLEECSGDML